MQAVFEVLDILDQMFFSSHVYNVNVPSFVQEWSMVVVCKSMNCEDLFWREKDMTDKMIRSKLGEDSGLKYFSGEKMVDFQTTNKIWRNWYDILQIDSQDKCKYGCGIFAKSESERFYFRQTIGWINCTKRLDPKITSPRQKIQARRLHAAS